MKASISFPELQNILKEKTEQNIGFAFVDDKTVKVTYPLNLGIIKKDISADLTILEIVGSDLLVKLDAGMGTDTLMNTALSLLHGKHLIAAPFQIADSFLCRREVNPIDTLLST